MTTINPICAYCTRFHALVMEREECDAFPEGIPEFIIEGQSEHLEPIDGDHGLLFSPKEGWEDLATPRTAAYHPDQKRAPRGSPKGGQWVDEGSPAVIAEVARQEAAAAANPNPMAHPPFVLGSPDLVDPAAVIRYVGAYGEEFTARDLPADVEAGPKKECYRNASLLVMQRSDLTYAEGFAGNPDGGLLFLHAWAVDQAGNVIDPTWGSPANTRYFGIRYDRGRYLKHLYRSRVYGVLGGRDQTARHAVATGGSGLR